MRIRVTHSIDDLADDLTTIAAEARPTLARAVRRNVLQGHREAQRFARQSSGPHGRLYYKRITAEMTGALTGEYGPTGEVAGNAVGAGWRHGRGNTDLARSADIVAVNFGQDVLESVGDLFWPGA